MLQIYQLIEFSKLSSEVDAISVPVLQMRELLASGDGSGDGI